jgi:hypothetical protein
MISENQLQEILLYIYNETSEAPRDSIRDIINKSLQNNYPCLYLNDDGVFERE